jgi:probable F420-dependent oxidoreductase
MEFGGHLPVFGPAATRDAILGVARTMEALGYDSVWVSDHVVIPWSIASRYPYSGSGDFPFPAGGDFLEPFTVLSAVAGATERLRLGTSVLVVPHRHPLLTAKIAATLDRLAPGRVVLGVGVGWMREEIELFGVPFARRGAWTDEAIRVMRACWAPAERTSFAGEFFRFQDLGCFPKPAAGSIPIWIGGHTPAAFRRVATLGDGWHAAFPTPEAAAADLARLREACREAGRDASTVTVSARVGYAARRPSDEVVAEIEALRDHGVTHVILETRMRDLADMTALYERFAREVRPRL